MPAAPLLLSVEEGAAQLRIGRSRMFDLIRRGEVRFISSPARDQVE